MLNINEIVEKYKTRRTINKYYRSIDESYKWPINGHFNVTNRAIKQIKKLEQEGLILDDLYSYAATIENIMSEIVNNPKNRQVNYA